MVSADILLQNSLPRVEDLEFSSIDCQGQVSWSSHPRSLAYIITDRFTPSVYENVWVY